MEHFALTTPYASIAYALFVLLLPFGLIRRCQQRPIGSTPQKIT